ncbi:uncharacterized protein [Medicago truncatula]|uniref:uncharacterized protein n=1 Tax=Medicago truncatula TaxID=3880 RepID=UPI000D2F4737|nr:uncharacterized protein LOC11423007 [Medicago truncatula]
MASLAVCSKLVLIFCGTLPLENFGNSRRTCSFLRFLFYVRLEDIPTNYHIHRSQIFLSGTVNWLASNNSSMYFILSLDLEESYRQLWLPDLEKESYRQLWLPDFENENENGPWILDVMRNCMCVFATSDVFLDVWIMEYGSEESWTKLYSVPNMQHRGLEVYKALYISEDDQLLLQCYEIESGDMKLVVYDSKNGTLNIPEFQNNYEQIYPNVYIASLISP